MTARKWRVEELSVVADQWNLKLKPAKLKGVTFLSPICRMEPCREEMDDRKE
jgi:hypothetical protein